MSRTMILAAAFSCAVGTTALHAQAPVGLELRGGAAFPSADLGTASLRTGGGFGFNGSYRFMPHFGVYAGWDWYRFLTDEPLAGSDFDVEATGYALGFQFEHPLTSAFAGWVRAGGIYNHVELENTAGKIIADSGHELGWEIGGGFSFPLMRNAILTPGVRYRTFSGTLNEVAPSAIPFDLSYFAVEIGFRWSATGMVSAARRN